LIFEVYSPSAAGGKKLVRIDPHPGAPPRSTSGRVLTHAIRAAGTDGSPVAGFVAAAALRTRTVNASDVAHAARGRARHSFGHASSFLRVLPSRTTLRLPPARHSGVVQRSRAYPHGKRNKPPLTTNTPRVGATPRVQGQRDTAVTRRRRAAIPSRRGRSRGIHAPWRLPFHALALQGFGVLPAAALGLKSPSGGIPLAGESGS